MLEIGFLPQIEQIVAELPDSSTRQSAFFTATWPKNVQRRAEAIVNDPLEVKIGQW